VRQRAWCVRFGLRVFRSPGPSGAFYQGLSQTGRREGPPQAGTSRHALFVCARPPLGRPPPPRRGGERAALSLKAPFFQ